MNELKSLSENEILGIKYFSGIATYNKTIAIKKEWLKQGGTICLDLGIVKELAEVFVNGKSVGVRWNAPYTIELGNALHRRLI